MDQGGGSGEYGEKYVDLIYVLVLVALWSYPFFHFLTSESWMCLLVNGISWFIFQHYFSFLLVLKIMTTVTIVEILFNGI